ncbi:MAG: polyprenyl synthetase family protein [Pyrinomonadaceae bacterium]|nr:polyprenyl synthetase family protein [Pyrinomonadaceae bacterium]
MQTFATQKKELLPNAAARRIFGLVQREMALVEAEFERQVRSNIQVVNYLGDYLRASGGKRVRPALLVLSNYAAGGMGNDENVIRLATVMEMLHTATLVHDDIIDNADVRRNRASVNARFGNQTAVLMGDWLYMSAFETSLRERSLEILDILTTLTRKMTEGELIQLTMIGRIDITEADYFDILKRKTAFLFAACAEIGAILAGAPLEKQHALRDFGMNLGIAFQLADDILDLTSESDDLGKAAGTDLLEGKITLPLIYLLGAEPGLRPKLEQVMLTGTYDPIGRDTIREMLRRHGTIDIIRAKANSFSEAARKNLDVLAKTEYRVALEEIPGFVIDRNS